MVKSEYLFQLLESVDPKLVHLAKKAAMAAVELEDPQHENSRSKKVKKTLSFKRFNEYAKGLAMGDSSILDIYKRAYLEAKRGTNEQGK